MALFRSINDFTSTQIDRILTKAARLRVGKGETSLPCRAVVGLLFLEPSLRTRLGFAAASIKLGATPVEVSNVRASAISMPESVEDTLRTLAGYSSLVVARVDQPLVLPPGIDVPLLNGGDRGPAAEHPSQSLIDLFAICQLQVPLGDQVIAVCGDLRMRAVRSLLLLLAMRRPRSLILVTEPELTEGLALPPQLHDLAEYRTLDGITDADSVYVAGIPHGAINEAGRARLRITREHLDRLPSHAGVFSPLPIIDEVEPGCLDHPRVRVFGQSNDGLYVRMAILELLGNVDADHESQTAQ